LQKLSHSNLLIFHGHAWVATVLPIDYFILKKKKKKKEEEKKSPLDLLSLLTSPVLPDEVPEATNHRRL
jgi:hypothetical protein